MTVKYPKFSGREDEDADAHMLSFEMAWMVNSAPPIQATDLMKRATFIPTLQKQAAVWIAQYGATHFATFDLLREAFLLRFREEKTRVHVLAKLGGWSRRTKRWRRMRPSFGRWFVASMQQLPRQSPFKMLILWRGSIKD